MSRRVSRGRSRSRCVKLCWILPTTAPPPGSPNPPASSDEFHVRGSSNNANGLPWLSTTICSSTASSSGTVDVVQQQRTGIGVGQSFEDQLGKLAQHVVATARAGRTDDRDPLGQETTGHEPEDLSRRPVEPLGIVNDADQRLLLGDVGEQRQHRQSDQEAIRRRRPAPEPEDRFEGIALTHREPLDVLEQCCCTADGAR